MKNMRDIMNLVESSLLAEVVNTDTPEFRSWFGDSKVVDKNGNPQPVYHGTGRPDRVGVVFRRSRATSGPMAYFTDDPAVASGYATGKADTSFEGEEDYNGWFKVKIPGQRTPVNIDKAWYYLNGAQKAKMAKLAPTVFSSDEGEIVQEPDHTNGVGNFDWSVKQYRGNVLAALVEGWLSGGILFNREMEFIKVLKMSGFPFKVEYADPHATQPFVYQTFLRITNPLDTSTISQSVVAALEKASKATRQAVARFGADAWSKKTKYPKSWMDELKYDLEHGTAYAWTTIPDWVTNTLKKLGYDGIKDQGGKHHDVSHTVWIPFEETQIKSAIGGTLFDPSKKSILK